MEGQSPHTGSARKGSWLGRYGLIAGAAVLVLCLGLLGLTVLRGNTNDTPGGDAKTGGGDPCALVFTQRQEFFKKWPGTPEDIANAKASVDLTDLWRQTQAQCPEQLPQLQGQIQATGWSSQLTAVKNKVGPAVSSTLKTPGR